MAFNQAAKSLIAQAIPIPRNNHPSRSERSEALDHIRLLCDAGFSPQEVLRDLRELSDSCGDEDKSIKLQISKLMIQVLGMLANEETAKPAPTFQLVIQGDGNRVNAMLCPLAPTL